LAGICTVFALADPLVAEEPCPSPVARQAGAEVKMAQARLRAIAVEEMDTDVPEAAQAPMLALKSALLAAVDARLKCEKDVVDAGALEAGLNAQLGGDPEGPSTASGERTTGGAYGSDLHFAVRRPEKPAGLLTVVATFDVECGRDTVLLVYRWDGWSWRRALSWQAERYDKVSGAFGDWFDFAVLQDGQAGEWLVAVVHGTPWCTSRVSGFAVDVLQPSRGGQPQRVTFHKAHGYLRDTDPTFRARADGFELRVSMLSLDLDKLERTGIFRYRVRDGKVERVQPAANNGRDFVDEWLQVGWEEASRWSAPAGLAALAAQHARLEKLQDYGTPNRPSFRYGPVRSCKDDPRHFQVELDLSPGGPTYFQIRTGDNSFEMVAVSESADPQCTGPDIMKKPR
jgi:hypothetical protein